MTMAFGGLESVNSRRRAVWRWAIVVVEECSSECGAFDTTAFLPIKDLSALEECLQIEMLLSVNSREALKTLVSF